MREREKEEKERKKERERGRGKQGVEETQKDKYIGYAISKMKLMARR